MKQIRRNTFETNSSSTHSFSIIKQDGYYGLPIDFIGECHLDLLHIKDEDTTVISSTLDKLSLILSVAYELCKDKDNFYESDDFLRIEKIVSERIGKEISIYIDCFANNIYGEDVEFCSNIESFIDDMSIEDFIFNDSVYVEINSHYI